MKAKERILYIVLILALLGFVGYSFFVEEGYEEEYYEKIRELERQADSLKSVNTLLDNQIGQFNSKISNLNNQLSAQNSKIQELREDAENRISSVDTLGNNELIRFFSERYNSSTDTSSDSTFSN